MLNVKNLSVNYGDLKVVDDLDLELADDEILMLVGPTGCGKTSILKALAGLIPISNGEINLKNWSATPTNKVPPEKRNLGMVFQDFALFPHLTVEQNIGFRLNDNEPVDEWIKLLGLESLRGKKPNTLSGGQKQRVALARTLAHQPSFILLDEPLSNLDAALKDDLRWEIRQALKSAGIPAIWVTHDQEEALSVGDRIGILRNGKLEQLDSPETCYGKPNNRFVARFLGEASFISGDLKSDNIVSTIVGETKALAINDKLSNESKVDVLLRPDDLKLRADEDGRAIVVWTRYEGSARLYAVELEDGSIVKVRSRHENIVSPGQKVSIVISTTHPLAVFEK